MRGYAHCIEVSRMHPNVFVNRWSGVQISHPAPLLSAACSNMYPAQVEMIALLPAAAGKGRDVFSDFVWN
jgi:hypothetical protein